MKKVLGIAVVAWLLLGGVAQGHEHLRKAQAKQAIVKDWGEKHAVHFTRCVRQSPRRFDCWLWVRLRGGGGEITVDQRVYYRVNAWPRHLRWHY